MGTSRRLQARLTSRQADRLGDFADAHLLSVSAAARILLARALDEDPGRATEQIALAALVASEHAVLLLASMFPEGDRRLRQQAESALEAAERRLAQLADHLRGEEVPGV